MTAPFFKNDLPDIAVNHDVENQLDSYYRQIKEIILNRQDCVSGLLPASTAINIHGDYTDAWVRDNVYSILAAWGLALAYRRQVKKADRAYQLEQSVVKLMRGLLTAMMRQLPKVEAFKHTQNPLDALHAKYDTKSGHIIVGDTQWGHLQLDATSLFLLMLAQMTASGLRIVFSLDEVNFVQNLVHYISRTYRTPDYGIWERGNKLNHGVAELNASSIGMAKAALEAMNNFNLFGKDGGQSSIIHVVSDDIARTRIALESLLPRESISKEVDAAVLSIIGFPAFAVDNETLRHQTQSQIIEKLQGNYGCKRFLRDGHQTVLEDSHRLHYEAYELKEFTDIECEWPLFFCYNLLNALFTGDQKSASQYREKLDALGVDVLGQRLLPELYRVPADNIDAEKANPKSQPRVPNENIPLVWAQSLFILGCLLQDGFIEVDDIDPLGRYRIANKIDRPTIKVALLAEDEEICNALQKWAIPSQTRADIAPVQVRDASELSAAYIHVGRNDRLGLTGRPQRQLRALSTSKLYILAGEPLLFLPQCMDQKSFYLTMDNKLLIERLRIELQYISQHWDKVAPPLLIINIKDNMLTDKEGYLLIDFLKQLQQNNLGNVTIDLNFITAFLNTTSYEKIGYLHDFQFSPVCWETPERIFSTVMPEVITPAKPMSAIELSQWEHQSDHALIEQLTRSDNLYAHLEMLIIISQRHDLNFDLGLSELNDVPCRVRDLLEEVYARAGDQHLWAIVRRCASVLGKYDINLEQSATDILVRQHHLTVGRSYSEQATLKRPIDSLQLLDLIKEFNENDGRQQILIQELIIHLGMLIKANPLLFKDMHTIRVGHILQLMIAQEKRKISSSWDQAFTDILALAPHQLAQRIEDVLKDYDNNESQRFQLESMHYDGSKCDLASARFQPNMNPHLVNLADWYDWREQQGSVGRESDLFLAGVWRLLHHCKGLMVGEKYNSSRRIDSENLLGQMTSGEQSFKLHINHILNKIHAPVYRQLCVEALNALAVIMQSNPQLMIDDTIVVDILIGHAVRLSWLQCYPDCVEEYDKYVSVAWQSFYQLPPHKVANGVLDALIYLLNNNA